VARPKNGAAQVAAELDDIANQVAELEERCTALRQAASLPAADLAAILDAVLTELDCAIGMLAAPLRGSGTADDGRSTDTDGAERRLLRAAFTDAPVPLFLLARDGTVLRVNKSAGQLLGAKPGYATGRPFTAFVTLPGRATVKTQLNAVARTGKIGRARCALLGSPGVATLELTIGLLRIGGEADRLIVAIAGETGGAPLPTVMNARQPDGRGAPGGREGVVEAITQRMDLVTAASRLLLENEDFSESITLQRNARLLASELAAWVMVDLDRRGLLVRQFVIGPEGPGLAGISETAASVNPTPGSLPQLVHDSGQAVLIAHADDAGILGPGPGDMPLLMLLGATSVISVPITDGEVRHGVLTLARRAGESHFEIADLGLVEELGGQLALAIRVDQLVRRRIEIADALQASLLPRQLPEIPGAELAARYIASTEGIEIGADFYDAYRTPDGWGLSVGDVCGKGQEAAAVTAAARHAIRVIAHEHADPARVLAGANKILLAEELSGGFVTASIAHLRWQKGVMHAVFGSAGHPSAAIVRRDGRVQMIGGGGLPLGLFPDPEPGLSEATMSEGDLLFLYTDGLTQARGLDRTYFQPLLAEMLAGHAGAGPDELAAATRRRLLEFTAGHLIDDITMLIMRVGPHPGRAPRKKGGRDATSR
jgi:serine phosphatase RsbU (regulator of sigma subunit)/PAS domain-containing protein